MTSSFSIRPLYAWALIVIAAAAFVSFFISLEAGVFALLFAILAWWTYQNGEDAFLFLIILAPLLPIIKQTHSVENITLIKDVIILTLFTKLFALPLLTKKLPYRRNILFAPLITLFAWTAFAALRADSHVLGILRARDIVLYALLYLAVLYLNHDAATMRRRFRWFMVSLAAVLALAAYQYHFAIDSTVLRFDPVRHVWIPRLSSTFGQPSVFGQYLVVAMSLLGSLALVDHRRGLKLAWAALIAVLLVAIFYTYSRSVWIAAALALLTLAIGWLKPTLKKRLSVILVLALLLVVGMWQIPRARTFLRTAVDPTYQSNADRLESAARLIASVTNTEALIGRGLGDVVQQNLRSVAGASIQETKDATLVDNQYLKTFIEMGLAGLLIYAWLYWRVARGAWQLVSGKNRLIGLFGLSFLAAFIIQAFFIDIWDIFPTNAYFWIIAALVSNSLIPKLTKS